MSEITRKELSRSLHDLLTGDEDARVCKDIPESACHDEPRNFFAYLIANLLGKIADEIASARLILPWLLASLGAPAAFTGFLVPIREAGVLLPQLVVAAVIRRMAIRKSVWLLGAGLSGIALALMAVVTGTLSGTTAGWAILGLLILFSLARGLCSVSAKDVLGKTVSKGRRGTLMGWSAGIASLAVLGIGIYVEWFSGGTPLAVLAWLLVGGALLWFIAIGFFAAIREQPGATEGGGNALTVALQSFGRLKSDPLFRDFVIGRALLLSVALAPPFYVLLAQQNTAEGLVGLGVLIIASGIAGSLSSPFWGRLSDYSSRWVMVIAALATGAQGILLYGLVEAGSPWISSPWLYAALFLTLSVFHGGVRLGRKVYLVDMATADTRAIYVALSNTLIGIAMLAGGLIGVLADVLDLQTVILLLAFLSLLAAIWALGLPEVTRE
ncbi:MFS transporter [Thiohalophilus thiocyanatoxydans]|uniref:Putative MFS family arabinose efflux permease n=1 Tax=Thiohalophilus thiocyanatoxydans TaxID=381308 RepID=A0A4R8ITS2_9GAMM|nr:MFS transporter [Thiohalophilus thiocyanatoxydans]TDY04038.1 putative MFS family arabinose efflux permease [Thiohalophilus thiocyanatoxydans]